MSDNEHGYCPKCGKDFDGTLIWDTFFDEKGNAEEADVSASMYGATRDQGRWCLKIGVYDIEKDRTTHWGCPDCGHEWDRRES